MATGMRFVEIRFLAVFNAGENAGSPALLHPIIAFFEPSLNLFSNGASKDERNRRLEFADGRWQSMPQTDRLPRGLWQTARVVPGLSIASTLDSWSQAKLTCQR